MADRPTFTLSVGKGDFLKAWKEGRFASRELEDALKDMAAFIKDAAIARAPGRTKRAVDVDVVRLGNNHLRITVGLKVRPKVALFVHEGTGLFGPLHHEIFAHGKSFAFEAGGHRVFARKIKGQRPQPFLREAIQLAESTYIPIRVKELAIRAQSRAR